MLGIYIHLPFCLKRCNYCDFCSSVLDENALENYVSALCLAISGFSDSEVLADTVYFGGGTPSK